MGPTLYEIYSLLEQLIQSFQIVMTALGKVRQGCMMGQGRGASSDECAGQACTRGEFRAGTHMMERCQLSGEPQPSPQQDQGAQSLRSGAEVGVFEEEKGGQSGYGHVDEVESRVMRSGGWSGARSCRI